MDLLWRDIVYAGRMLRSRLGFAAAAILSLALGIGACTVIFSVVDGVLLRPLPYPAPERIVQLKEISARGSQMPVAELNFLDVRGGNHSLEALAEYAGGIYTVTGGAEPIRTGAYAVSQDFFKALGVAPLIGRTLEGEDDRQGGVAVVSYGLWQRLLGGKSDLSAARLTVMNQSSAVIGVLPQGFKFPADAEVWLPRTVFPPDHYRTAHNWEVIGRLRADASLAQARSDVSAIGHGLKAQFGDQVDAVDIALLPLRDYLVGDTKPVLVVMLAAVGVLLLIACANVANMLLAQATARHKEFAVRQALGASRGRLARQFITESTLLALIAGAIGVMIAFWGVGALLSLNREALPRVDEVAVNGRAMGFTLLLAFVVAITVGLAPVLRFSGADLHTSLKEAGRGASAHGATNRLRSALVVAQVALTLILLTGAGLLGKSFLSVLHIDPGFRPENTMAMETSMDAEEPAEVERRAQFHQQLLDGINRIPGVSAAGGINRLPMTGGGANGTFLIMNGADPPEAEAGDIQYWIRLKQNPQTRTGYAEYRIASPGYFEAMGIPLLAGRLFDRTDSPGAVHAAVISESLAKRYFADDDPVGKRIEFGNMDGDMHALHIIGVVGDVHEYGLEANPRPTLYANYVQRPRPTGDFTIVARGNIEPAAMVPAMREVVQAIRGDVPLKFRAVAQVFSSSLNDRRFNLVIFAIFALAALLLAATGVYAVMSYAVTQRTQEIGIRMALGARFTDIMKLTMGQGFKLISLGLVIGLGGALAMTRLLATLLFGVSTRDPLTFAGVTLLLCGIALLACYIPARRATRVDPMVALRYE